MRTVIALLALVASTLTPAATAVIPHAPSHPSVDIPIWVTRPCASEGDVNCRWIATGPNAQGNGTGHTSVVRRLPHTHLVCTFYADRLYAKRHDTCVNAR